MDFSENHLGTNCIFKKIIEVTYKVLIFIIKCILHNDRREISGLDRDVACEVSTKNFV